MAVKENKTRTQHQRYSWLFKREVIMDHLQNQVSFAELAERYGASSRLISYWVQQYGSELKRQNVLKFNAMTAEEREQFELLKRQNDALKQELEFTQMKAKVLEIIVDIAKEEYGMDLRKKHGAKQPKKQGTTTRRRR